MYIEYLNCDRVFASVELCCITAAGPHSPNAPARRRDYRQTTLRGKTTLDSFALPLLAASACSWTWHTMSTPGTSRSTLLHEVTSSSHLTSPSLPGLIVNRVVAPARYGGTLRIFQRSRSMIWAQAKSKSTRTSDSGWWSRTLPSGHDLSK